MAEIYSNPAEWWNLTDQFRGLNKEIIELENLIRADPVVAHAISADVQATRVKYEIVAQQFIDLYRAVFGEVPTGLTGLGLLIPAWAVVTVAAIAGTAWSIHEICATLRVQAQMAQARAAEANRTRLIAAGDEETKRADVLYAQGRKAEADAARERAAGYYGQAGTPATPPTEDTFGDLSAFLKKNWPWVLAGGAAAVYVMKVL